MDLEGKREGRRHGGRVEWRKKEWEEEEEEAGRVGLYMARLSRAKACGAFGATQSCHVRLAAMRVPAWQLGRAEAFGGTLQESRHGTWRDQKG